LKKKKKKKKKKWCHSFCSNIYIYCSRKENKIDMYSKNIESNSRRAVPYFLEEECRETNVTSSSGMREFDDRSSSNYMSNSSQRVIPPVHAPNGPRRRQTDESVKGQSVTPDSVLAQPRYYDSRNRVGLFDNGVMTQPGYYGSRNTAELSDHRRNMVNNHRRRKKDEGERGRPPRQGVQLSVALGDTQKQQKIGYCGDFQQGRCARGQHCKFLHEMRPHYQYRSYRRRHDKSRGISPPPHQERSHSNDVRRRRDDYERRRFDDYERRRFDDYERRRSHQNDRRRSDYRHRSYDTRRRALCHDFTESMKCRYGDECQDVHNVRIAELVRLGIDTEFKNRIGAVEKKMSRKEKDKAEEKNKKNELQQKKRKIHEPDQKKIDKEEKNDDIEIDSEETLSESEDENVLKNVKKQDNIVYENDTEEKGNRVPRIRYDQFYVDYMKKFSNKIRNIDDQTWLLTRKQKWRGEKRLKEYQKLEDTLVLCETQYKEHKDTISFGDETWLSFRKKRWKIFRRQNILLAEMRSDVQANPIISDDDDDDDGDETEEKKNNNDDDNKVEQQHNEAEFDVDEQDVLNYDLDQQDLDSDTIDGSVERLGRKRSISSVGSVVDFEGTPMWLLKGEDAIYNENEEEKKDEEIKGDVNNISDDDVWEYYDTIEENETLLQISKMENAPSLQILLKNNKSVYRGLTAKSLLEKNTRIWLREKKNDNLCTDKKEIDENEISLPAHKTNKSTTTKQQKRLKKKVVISDSEGESDVTSSDEDVLVQSVMKEKKIHNTTTTKQQKNRRRLRKKVSVSDSEDSDETSSDEDVLVKSVIKQNKKKKMNVNSRKTKMYDDELFHNSETRKVKNETKAKKTYSTSKGKVKTSTKKAKISPLNVAKTTLPDVIIIDENDDGVIDLVSSSESDVEEPVKKRQRIKKTTTTTTTKVMKCIRCDFTTTRKLKFNRHVKECTKRKFCSGCMKTFYMDEYLDHLDERKKCPQIFANKRRRQEDMKTVQNRLFEQADRALRARMATQQRQQQQNAPNSSEQWMVFWSNWNASTGDPFQCLGFESAVGVTENDLKARYHTVAKAIHPDKCKHALATRAFANVSNAYKKARQYKL